MSKRGVIAALAIVAMLAGCKSVAPKVTPPGEAKSAKTAALEIAAVIIQRNTPAEDMKKDFPNAGPYPPGVIEKGTGR